MTHGRDISGPDRHVTKPHAQIIEPLKAILDCVDRIPVDRRDALEAGIRGVEELVEKQGDELVVRSGCMEKFLFAMLRLLTIVDDEPNPFLGGKRLVDLAPALAPYIAQIRAQGDDPDYQAGGVRDIERFISSIRRE